MLSLKRKKPTLRKPLKVLFVVHLITFFAGIVPAFAQMEYNKGDVLLNFGIGSNYYYAGGTPIVASVEFALNDAFSIGPYVAYTSYGYRTPGYRWNYTFIDFGARASYHFSKHLKLPTKLDLYGGAMLGFVVSSYSDNNTVFSDPYGNRVTGGVFGGARWYFTQKFSANGEVGVATVAPLMIGITFKF